MPHYEFFCHACKKTFSKILAREGEDCLLALRQPQSRAALGRLLRGHLEEERVNKTLQFLYVSHYRRNPHCRRGRINWCGTAGRSGTNWFPNLSKNALNSIAEFK